MIGKHLTFRNKSAVLEGTYNVEIIITRKNDHGNRVSLSLSLSLSLFSFCG